ncbi:MAG TPA: Ig domain-containing protein [Thermoanaerobaculia bacterium]|nr:Ig domain-containing protein [Thermoanaerobaculia bacterium]
MRKVLLLSVLLIAVAPFVYPSCSTIDITDEFITPFHLNVAGSFQLHAYGGTAPYTFTLQSGSLPPGLSLSSGGLISGTPTTAGEYLVCFTVTDSVGCHVTKCFYLEVFNP